MAIYNKTIQEFPFILLNNTITSRDGLLLVFDKLQKRLDKRNKFSKELFDIINDYKINSLKYNSRDLAKQIFNSFNNFRFEKDQDYPVDCYF